VRERRVWAAVIAAMLTVVATMLAVALPPIATRPAATRPAATIAAPHARAARVGRAERAGRAERGLIVVRRERRPTAGRLR
jgi:hypothetical protein